MTTVDGAYWETIAKEADAEISTLRRDLDRHIAIGTALASENENLRAALKPFAAACSAADDERNADRDNIWEAPAAMEITVGDLRNAAKVYEQPPQAFIDAKKERDDGWPDC